MVAPVQTQPSGVVAQVAAVAALFKPGQVLEALVLGKTADGLVALRIGEIAVNAQLPQALPAGTTLQLQVKVVGSTPQLAMLGAPQLPAQASVTTSVPPPTLLLPAVTVMPLQRAPAPDTPTSIVLVQTTGASAPRAPAGVAAPAPSSATGAVAVPSGSAVPVVAHGTPAASPSAPQAAVPAPAIAESPQPVVSVNTTIASTPATPSAVGPASTPLAASAAPASQPTTTLPAASAGAAAPAAQFPPPSSVAEITPAAPSASQPASAPVNPAVSLLPAVPNIPLAAVSASPQPPPALVSAAPSASTSPAVLAAAPAVTEVAAPNPLLVAQGTPRPPASLADLPRPAPLPAAAPAGQPVPQASTPAAALAQMVPEALSRQNAMAPLFVSLATVVARPAALPEPVLRAALQVLGQRVVLPAAGLTGFQLDAAIAKSGVYLEAALANGAPAADLKSGLVALKGALATWLRGDPAPVTPAQQAPPPLRGVPPRAESLEPPPVPETPREMARALHSQADAALSRVKLMQLASLPDADPARAATAELRAEVPFLLGQQLVMAQFQVTRDGGYHKTVGKRGWTLRLAMHLPGAGEIGAEVGLLGRSVNVALWAADAGTSERLEAALPELAPALAALGLEPGAVRVRPLPPAPPRPSAGRYLDSRR